MPKIKMIVACDTQGGIGKNNRLPWPSNSNDMEWLREKTKDAILIVGRRTYDSLPKSIKTELYNGNDFIVLKRDPQTAYNVQHGSQFHTAIGIKVDDQGVPDYASFLKEIDRLLSKSKDKKRNVFVFGGAEIYNLLLPIVDEVYISTFQGTYDCDSFVDREKIIAQAPYCSYRDDEDEKVVFEIFHRTLNSAKKSAPYYTLDKQTNFLKG